MSREQVEKIADAVLYEGYMLYPYRASALKNRQRWAFGTLYPPGYAEVARGTESSTMHSECLLHGGPETGVAVTLRFLQLNPHGEATPRTAAVEAGPNARIQHACEYKQTDDSNPVHGEIECLMREITPGVCQLTVDVRNLSDLAGDAADRDRALLASLMSAHLILSVSGGEFASLLDPPPELAEAARACRNLGCFPVLVGEAGDSSTMLCSPILLYDYPQVAPESAGDFFDSTEMDEMLTLRVLTLTDEEKAQLRGGDDRVRQMLERTEATAREQLQRTHGAIRSLRPAEET